ncbi:BatD family protein [Paraburkholderia sp. BCC1886]|uniref:BatD family protein n=1 Tax=Paraburkholderia sp. BCC1886 TaxID=2562670 RepID=UPI0011838B0B|nr:BatD family protein [Paraburkholderia sp. BCC1886]
MTGRIVRVACAWRRASIVRLLCLVLATLLASFYAAMPAPAFADPAPRLLARAHLEPAGPVVAGSEVKLVVDLLTTTWFTEAPDWPLFTLDDALVSLPDEQADNLSEDIDGVRWFGVRRAYRIAPRAGKTYDIAPFAITVHPGGASVPVRLTTPALELVATLPPGARDMATFFPTASLSATQTITSSAEPLRTGDTITRTVTQRAAGSESMMIPPLALGEIDGARRYPGAPVTRNIVQDRVGLVAGERIDSATYVVGRKGRFTLPPVVIEWWNSATQKPEKIVLPARTFSVSAVHERPIFSIPAEVIGQGMPHRILVIHARQWVTGGVIALALVFLLWMRRSIASYFRRAMHAIRAAHQRYLDSDALAWRQLRALARRGDLHRTIPALYRWIDRSRAFGRPARMENLAHPEHSQQPDVTHMVDAVMAHYDAHATPEPQWKDMQPALRAALHSAKAEQHRRRTASALPPLNDF